jgi:serine/threonine-protein kinase
MSEPDAKPGTKHPILIAETDRPLPTHWPSGALKYTDFEPLAEGGTATLEVCTDKNLHRRVVYKTLHPHLLDSELEVKRFLREARVTSMIPHPGTVPVYELGRDRLGKLFFTMKRLEGRDLRTILMDLSARKRDIEAQFPLPRMIDILIDACQTIGYAHNQGVIHRDLKPANILIGEFGEVTVLDWGLAKVRGEKESSQIEQPTGEEAISMELTQPGRRYGTPLYMSPEQARGDEVDERTDIYNLGSILFEFLTAKNLVWGTEVEEVLHQVLERPTPVPREVAPDRTIPPELEAICLKALAKEPADRYDDMSALISDLLRFRAGEEVSVYPWSLLRRIDQFRERHALAFTAIASASIGGLIVGLAVWLSR